jgi:hypothetical protein
VRRWLETSSLFKVSVDRTVILPVADVEVVALAECDDDPPHDAVRTPSDPATKTAAVHGNRPIATPLSRR